MLKFEENLASRVSGALQPMLGVQVTVTASNGLLATLYADDESTVLGNPLETDTNGYFGFKAANGEYTLTFAGAQIATTARKIELYDADDDPPLTLAQATLPTAASRIGFQASGEGSTGRTVENKLQETVSVKDKGATGDGVTVDQVALVAAVAYAYATGSILSWPAGTYISDASIPNLHSVVHRGPGIIKRGVRTFAVNPTGKSAQANSLYIATTGSSDNDGLSEAEPMVTFQNAFNALTNYDLAAGNWSVTAAAGTYNGSMVQTFSQPSMNRVTVRGPAVGGHPSVPTAIIGGCQASCRLT